MGIEMSLALVILVLGALSIFKPTFLIYLFIALPVLNYIPSAILDFNGFKLFNFGSINIYPLDFLIVCMFIFLIISFFKNTNQFYYVTKTPLSKIVLIYICWELFIGSLSFIKGIELQNLLRKLANDLVIFLIIAIPLIPGIKKEKNKVFYFATIAAIIIVLAGLSKYYIFNEIQLTSSDTQRTLNANAVVLLLFPFCYVLFCSEIWRIKSVAFIFVCLIILGIHFAGHRSGWIAFFFALTMWFFYQEKKLRLAWIPLWSAALIVTLFFVSFFINIENRTLYGDTLIRISDTFDMTNRSTQERLSKWKYSLDTVIEKPLLGLGRYPVYTSQTNEENRYLANLFDELNRAPHNIIANKGLHEGLFGVTILLIIFYIIYNQIKKISPQDKNYFNFLKTFILTFLLFSMFNTTFFDNSIFCISLGLLNVLALEKAEHMSEIKDRLQQEGNNS